MNKNAAISLRLALAGVLSLAALGLLDQRQAANAYSSIKVSTSAIPSVVGKSVRWNLDTPRVNVANRRVHYVIGSQGCADRTTFTGPFDEFEAIQRSFNAWRDLPRSEIDFEFRGVVDNPDDNGDDDINMVFFSQTSLGAGVFALTTTVFSEDNGDILDADLVFNDVDFVWDTTAENATSGTVGRTAIESIGIHEIGHFIGLDHSFTAAATIFPFTDSGAINIQTPEIDDAAQINVSHPDPDALSANNATVKGNVSSGGTSRFGVNVSLVDVASGTTVISSISDRTTTSTAVGDYEIVDVPPGNYWVVGTPIADGNIGSYYSSAFTSFIPAIRGVTVGTVAEPTILRVKPGDNLTGVDLVVGSLAAPFEPNDDTAGATPVVMGQALGARIEAAGDADFYAIAVQNGEKFRFQVHSDTFGDKLNPEMTLFDTDGTTKLVTGEFGAPAFVQEARDIEPDAFGLAGVDFDCRINFTATSTGTYFLRVRGTANSRGDYILTTWSDRSFSTVDVNATTITADVAGAAPGSAAFKVTIKPRNTAGVAFPNSGTFNVQLLDLTSGTTVLDTINGAGPWEFNVTPPASAGVVTYGARVDGTQMDRTLALPFANVVNAAQSRVNIVATSLAADGRDTGDIEVAVRDAAGRLIVDGTLDVVLTTSAGTLTAGTASGSSVDAVFDAATGLWKGRIRAPSSGAALTVNCTVAGTAITGESISLTAKAATTAVLPPITGTQDKEKDGGGCVLASAAPGWRPLLGLSLLVLAVLALVVRPFSRSR